MSLECRHCSAFATCGVEPALLRRGEQCNQRRVRALKTPTLLDVFGVPRRLKTSKSRTLSSANAGLESTSYSVTNTYRWGWHHVKAQSYHWRRQCGGYGSSPKAGRRVLPKAASSY